MAIDELPRMWQHPHSILPPIMFNWLKKTLAVSENTRPTNSTGGPCDKTPTIAIPPNEYATHIKRGNEFLSQGMPEEAAECYRQAITANPAHAEGFLNLGFVLRELKLIEEAERNLKQAILIDPAIADAYYLLGGIAQERGNLAGAIEQYNKTLEHKPDFEIVYGELCLLLFQSGQKDRARKVIEQGLALYPESAELHCFLGNLYVDEKKFELAIPCYQQALLLQPNRAEIHALLGNVYKDHGNTGEALACYRKVRSLDPTLGSDYALPELPRHLGNELRNKRSVRDGYTRGWGIQFGDLRGKVLADPLYQEGVALAAGRTILNEDNRINLYLLLKFFLPHLPFGHIVEFGTFRGGNAIFLAHVARHLLPGVNIYALDTFAGMPNTDEGIDQHCTGDFADVDLVELRAYCKRIGLDNIEFVQGLFEETSPSLLERAGPIVLAHIDCDIYSAVCYSYEVVKNHMARGGYLVFDDANVSSCLGATEAVEDLLIRRDGLNSEQIYPHFVFRAFFNLPGEITP